MKRIENTSENRKYIRAKKRVKDIKSFYNHLAVYLAVNLFFIGRRIYRDISSGDSFIEAIFDINNYNFFFWWGLGLILHAVGTFGIPNMFSKDWEDRKIKELMNR